MADWHFTRIQFERPLSSKILSKLLWAIHTLDYDVPMGEWQPEGLDTKWRSPLIKDFQVLLDLCHFLTGTPCRGYQCLEYHDGEPFHAPDERLWDASKLVMPVLTDFDHQKLMAVWHDPEPYIAELKAL
jgi:hypothetical protein